jgi:hypothetical protein
VACIQQYVVVVVMAVGLQHAWHISYSLISMADPVCLMHACQRFWQHY